MKSQVVKCSVAFLFLISFAFMNTQKTFAQTEFPENSAGKRAREITDLLNSGEKSEIEKYVNDNFAPPFKNAFPMEQHVGIFIKFHNDNKEFNLYDVKSFSESQIVFTLWSPETNNLLSIELVLEAKEPHRVEMLGLRPSGKLDDQKKKNN